MRLNTKYSIALHCLVFLAEYGDQMKVTSEVLARSTGCNPVIIRNILGALQRENFVTIARGVGGAHLNTDPKKLTVWQVYQAVEPEGLEHFMNLHPHPSGKCPVDCGGTLSPVSADRGSHTADHGEHHSPTASGLLP